MSMKKAVFSQNKLNRRTFLKSAALASSATALSACSGQGGLKEFFKRDFRSLSKERITAIIKNLEQEYTKTYGKPFSVSAKEPIPDTLFGYGLDISRCIGCRKCVYGCVDENNQSRDPQIHWIQVLEMEKETGIDYLHANLYYDHEEVPYEGHFYLPVACQQCKNPPCVKACPVGATWKDADGIVVIDYDWCIGCRGEKSNWTQRKSIPKPIISGTVRVTKALLKNAPSASSGSVKAGTLPVWKSVRWAPENSGICWIPIARSATFSKTRGCCSSKKSSTPNRNSTIFTEHDTHKEVTG